MSGAAGTGTGTGTGDGSGARQEVLARIRSALRDVPEDETADGYPVPRDYRLAHLGDDPRTLVDALARNLTEYRARVHRCADSEIAQTVAELLARRGSASYLAPDGLPETWLSQCPAQSRISDVGEGSETPVRRGVLTPYELDRVGSVITACALAIAETGTLVLDGGAGQGRRALTLVPDHHVCVVRCPEQVVASVAHALPRLDPGRPLTWISGPSATSDIEFSRVEGVHGPRVLDVVLAGPGRPG